MMTVSKNQKIQIAADAEALSRAAADAIVAHIRKTLQNRDMYSLVLSGGSTPIRLYRLLADDSRLRGKIPWGRVHFFWGDERHVPPDHPDSNYQMAFEALLSKIPIPSSNIHRMYGEEPDAAIAAEDYARDIRHFFSIASGEFPRFNCVLLGLGADGHTASLFPGSAALAEQKHLVAANWVEKFNSFRITLTVPTLNNADLILVLVSGSGKAEALKAVLEGSRAPDRYPAQRIQPRDGKLLWLLDTEAAKHLAANHRRLL